jgi:acyl-CoA thioester hydrolase
LDMANSAAIGLVVETSCRFHKPLSFPELVDAGLRVAKLGNTSVRYEIGLFKHGEDEPAASGHFVHVWVDRASQRPTPLPEAVRQALQPLVASA